MANSIRLFCTDLDGTIFGEPNATRRFVEFWNSLPLEGRPLLCYNSGRLVSDQLRLIRAEKLIMPEFLVGGVGTELYDARARRFVAEFSRRFLSPSWSRRSADDVARRRPGIERQPDDVQTEFKSSWFWPNASSGDRRALTEELKAAGLGATVVYSSNRDLDILPAGAGKGSALEWLCDCLGIGRSSVLVAGDSANDAALFELEGVRGILAANRHQELCERAAGSSVFEADFDAADGVIEGLRHFLAPAWR